MVQHAQHSEKSGYTTGIHWILSTTELTVDGNSESDDDDDDDDEDKEEK